MFNHTPNVIHLGVYYIMMEAYSRRNVLHEADSLPNLQNTLYTCHSSYQLGMHIVCDVQLLGT